MIRPFCSESVFNILLPGDVVVPKCPRSELLLEFTTLRPVRFLVMVPGIVYSALLLLIANAWFLVWRSLVFITQV